MMDLTTKAQRDRLQAGKKEVHTLTLKTASLKPGPSCACFFEAQRDRLQAGKKEVLTLTLKTASLKPGPSCACFFEAQRDRLQAGKKEVPTLTLKTASLKPGPSCACFFEAQRDRLQAGKKEVPTLTLKTASLKPGPFCACFFEAQRDRPCTANRQSSTFLARSFYRLCAVATLSVAACCAQQTDTTSGDVVQPSATLSSQILDHDFVNYFVFGNGTYDTNLPGVRSATNSYGAAFGWDVGGGITASRAFKGGQFSLSYRGDYRHYNSSSYGNGNTQNLSLLFSKQLSRRWGIGFNLGAGILEYGGSLYSMAPSSASTDITNPLSSRSRFASAGVNVTYSQTRRLSYVFGGSGSYSSYNYSGAARSLGGTGTASINYRTTARTTVGGTYSHSYYTYSSNFGSSTIDGGFLTLSHMFSDRWSANLSAGETHSHSQGTITIPVTLLLGQQLVSGFITGPYNRSSNTPSFQLGVSHYLKRSSISFTGGQGVNAGNGTYLTSKDQFATLTFSVSHRLSNFAIAGSYFRLTSIANTVSNTYSTANFSASYGYTLHKYLALNFRYDFIHYDNFYNLQGVNESRVSLGASFSSKSVPLTLF